METVWGITAEQFWAPASELEFWENLPLTEEAHGIVRGVLHTVPREKVAFLSSAAGPWAMEGKRRWLKRHFPELAEQFLFKMLKQLVANPGDILIDDYDRNLDSWTEHGGTAICVPRPWNRLHTCAFPVHHVLSSLWGALGR
jgi:5'(3')-deoxyribonucleotidase